MRDNPTVVLSGIYHAREYDAPEYQGYFVTYSSSWVLPTDP
jgi:hypothetical protein